MSNRKLHIRYIQSNLEPVFVSKLYNYLQNIVNKRTKFLHTKTKQNTYHYWESLYTKLSYRIIVICDLDCNLIYLYYWVRITNYYNSFMKREIVCRPKFRQKYEPMIIFFGWKNCWLNTVSWHSRMFYNSSLYTIV